jgi:ATP-dependent DNA helicase RecG
VEESEKLDLKAAESYYSELKESYFKDIAVGLIHGKMNWKEKEEVMLKFAEKKFDVLISTTVIEVGIDVPNANIMVINDAYRFGLSQLHQLRGRVGRGTKQAYCVLVTKDELYRKTGQFNFNFDYLSPAQIEKNKSSIRLSAMAEYTDGFKLSEIDMKLRGPGNIYGTQQSGFPEFKYVDIIEDSELIKEAKHQAFKIVNEDPKLETGYNKLLKSTLLHYYKENLRYSKIA